MNAEALGLRPAGCQATQPRPTLCSPPDGSPPGSSVREILQARMLAWVPFSRGPCPRGGPVSCVPGLAGGLSSTSAPARRFAAAEICVKKLQDSQLFCPSRLSRLPVSLTGYLLGAQALDQVGRRHKRVSRECSTTLSCSGDSLCPARPPAPLHTWSPQ